MNGHPTGTVTFLFTDIEGSTKLAREFPERWESSRSRHHQILREAIESNSGFVFQIIGDAFCAAFHTAANAIKAAVEAQQRLQGEAWGEYVIRVRMGIHTGEAELRDDEYHGYLTLSLVQRIMSAGHGGQVLVSGATENLLRSQLLDNASLRDLGKHEFRDVPQPVRVFQVVASNLPVEFPALRTIHSHPNNLPTQLTSFVGREKELADIQKLLSDTHILTLIGPGGTGKTRISIQVASALLDIYPDGLWLVELAPILDPLLVPRVTARIMGLRDEPQRPVIDMLCDYLQEKKMLLILDNCEHLVDACARMADRILHAAPDVRILASSREALGIGGEVTYRVPSLGLPDIGHLPSLESLSQYEAVKLFIDRAKSAVPTFAVTNDNAPAVAQICHRLDGIPLAIELAAAKIRVLGIEQIAKRLDDRFRLLTGGSRTALERHQTLRAAIDWSYNLLPVAEQVLFRRLSVFIGGWTLEAAEAVCVDELIKNADVLDLLEQLINKSLVLMEEHQSETRYSMLETMRQYANEKLAESGESDTLRDRHLEYFLNLAETAEPHLIRPEQLEWLAKLDADYENIRLALQWALNKESAEPSLQLCAALGLFWSIRCYWLEGSNWLSNALTKPHQQSTSENISRVRALYQDVMLAEHLDDLERMENSSRQSLALAEEVSDKRDRAIARLWRGSTLDRQGDYENAYVLMEQSLSDFRELHDPYWEAVCYRWGSADLALMSGLTFEEKGVVDLRLARKAGERINLAEALLGSARDLLQFKHLDEASEYAKEAIALFKQMGVSANMSGYFLAEISWLKGHYEEARSTLTEVQEQYRLVGEKNLRSIMIEHLGTLALEQGDIELARAHFEEALETAIELEEKEFKMRRFAMLGSIYYLERRLEDFRRNYRESFSLVKDLNAFRKSFLLLWVLNLLHNQRPQNSARLLGALANFEKETARPFRPLWQRYYDRAEAHTSKVLGDATFESAFAEGHKMSLDEALELALKMVEEM